MKLLWCTTIIGDKPDISLEKFPPPPPPPVPAVSNVKSGSVLPFIHGELFEDYVEMM